MTLWQKMQEGVKIMNDLYQLKQVFIKDLKLKGSAIGTIKSIKSHLNIFFEHLDHIGISKREELTKHVVYEFQSYLSGLENNEGYIRYSLGYRSCILNTLRDFLKSIHRLGYLLIDLSIWIENPKHPDRITKNILSLKEIKSFFYKMKLETLYDVMIKVICVVLYGTGLRLGEVLSLKVNDINFDDMNIRIYDRKAHIERLVVFGDVVKEYLLLFINNIRPKLLKRKKRKYLFCSYLGIHITDEIVTKYIRKFCKQAGIEKKITSHCFRHSYCSHLLSNGLGIREIAELVGHKDLDVTARYARSVNDDIKVLIKKNHPRERMKKEILGT